MIKCKNLTCKYDKKLILDDISLHVKHHLSILGANGSGKSTLAKVLCNLIDYEGEIFIKDKNITDYKTKELAKIITYIPTKLELYDAYITVYDFVLLGRYAYKENFFDYTSSDYKEVDKNLKLLSCEHLKHHTLSSLSSGEQQLILIAQALTQKSKIIIFDEPTANLDPSNSKVIANHIKNLKESLSIILITHDLHLASYIDSPVLFISDKKAHFYENRDDFFSEDILQNLYGVAFKDLMVRYE
jgi:iron complex transport system ATP-binding protein